MARKKKINKKVFYAEIKNELKISQQQPFELIIDFFLKEKKRFLLLSGGAGTGKTYLVSKCAEYIKLAEEKDILMCAPTNKAVRVLKENLPYKKGFFFSTVHSALGLKEQIDAYGNVIFAKDDSGDPVKISDFSCVIIDETSMIDDVLFNKLLEATEKEDIKILFVGDKDQIPPVECKESVVFTDATKKKYKITEIALSEIIRQEKNNPIIDLSLAIRSDLKNPNVLNKLIEIPKYNNGEVQFVFRTKSSFFNLINDYFITEYFDEDANYCKVIAWTNEIVNKTNNVIRQFKYGAEVPQLVLGEKLIFDKPWIEKKFVVYATNEEVTVRSYSIEFTSILNESLSYYLTSLSKEGSHLIEKTKIKILKSDSFEAFERIKNKLKENALSYPKGSTEAKSAWVAYYNIINTFASIKYNYAITAHRSQGSTYTNAIIANYDMDKNYNVLERNRIKYTAVTRPKEKLFIII